MRSTAARSIARGIGVVCCLAGGSGSTAQQAPPVVPENPRSARAAMAAAPSVAISNGVLRAVVLLPDAARGFYRGTRFDWSGVVGSLTYRDTEYYGPWFDQIADNVRDYLFHDGRIVAGPNTAIVGPAETFDSTTPPGWAEAAAGGGFLKIGVGILRKPDDGAAYAAFRTYDILDPGVWTVRRQRDRVYFTHTLAPAATTYGYIYRKRIVLVPGRPEMRIEHALTNTGRIVITSTMYNHNFLTLGAGAAREGLVVETPFPMATTRVPVADVATIAGNRVAYRRGLRDKEVVSVPITGFGPDARDNRLSVTTATGAGFTVTGDQPLASLQLWSIRDTVAVEPFVRLTIAPGETKRWSSTYRYRRAR